MTFFDKNKVVQFIEKHGLTDEQKLDVEYLFDIITNIFEMFGVASIKDQEIAELANLYSTGNLKDTSRETKIKKLADQYATEFADNGYPQEFKAQGAMTECNFGGKLIILHESGDACIVWSDWSDEAIDDVLVEYEIEYKQNPNFPEMEDEMSPGFVMNKGTENEQFYPLYNFGTI